MTSRKRVVIATASYGGGHHEIAEALADALRARGDSAPGVATIDLLERCAPRSSMLARVAYTAGEDFFPDGAADLAGLARGCEEDPLVRELLSGGVDVARSALGALRPDAVIATHPVAAAIAAEARGTHRYAVAAVVPGLGEDRAWVHPSCDMWFVQTAEARDALARRGVGWAGIVLCGVPVRGPRAPKPGSRPPHGRSTVAVPDTGRADVRALVSELVSRGMHVVTTLGDDAGTRGRRGADASVTTFASDATPADLAAECEVLVTGPCGASQWVAPAFSTPMIVVGPVPALEAETVRILVASGAALVVPDVSEAGRMAAYLMRHPERRASMAADAGRLGRPAAARAVAEAVSAHLA